MSVKSFKFVSPGVFINEIDNSFIAKTAEAIGPVVVGRSSKGMGLTPIKVRSYNEFVEAFGTTVPGNAGGDVYRDGNYQSPMYGTYAAKAFLNSNVAPLTYVRLLGSESPNATSAGKSGWRTTQTQANSLYHNGGAFGLFVIPSSSTTVSLLGTASLAALWYVDSGSHVVLSGAMYGGYGEVHTPIEGWNTTASYGAVIGTDSSKLFTVMVHSVSGSGDSVQASEKITFNFDDSSDNYIRNKFNTNPQLTTTAGTFFPAKSYKNYWLGETYEQNLRWSGSLDTGDMLGFILPVASASMGSGPNRMQSVGATPGHQEGVAGWFIGQDLGTAADHAAFNNQKLFRLKGRNHGEWLHKNCKVTIDKIRASTTLVSDYGTFSIVIRDIRDTDASPIVLERFDNLNLDPTSPDYVERRLGDKYVKWDSSTRRLKTYGEYDNQSKYVYVDMNDDVANGGTDARLLPFGYFGPPRYSGIAGLQTEAATGARYVSDAKTEVAIGGGRTSVKASFVTGGVALFGQYSLTGNIIFGANAMNAGVASNVSTAFANRLTASIVFPHAPLRVSASDGGMSDFTKASFGMASRRTATSTRGGNLGLPDFHRRLHADIGDDPTTIIPGYGVDPYAYMFTMDDVQLNGSVTNGYFHQSGSRKAGTSYSAVNGYSALLNTGMDSFTAPFFGGHDGLDIHYPDPFYNAGMTSATETTNYAYYTMLRAIDTVADPELLDMNILAAPGLTNSTLADHMVDVCEERADSLAIIDLPSVYIPHHEAYHSDKADRVGTTPQAAATALRDRRIDSSYGCTFYPWVQTRDSSNGRLIWIPPSVAMLGVLASSHARSEVWFAPAGFNRGGLSEGAAGIPVTNITERLTSRQRDTLYEYNINPIASFPSTGIVVFGQKTLQERQSALDRINVRRLVIFMKKQISILSTQVLFEQNVQATWNRFKGLVEPFLANVQTRFGITEYKLTLDESTTTPDLIDQNILYAKIMIKPARAIEFIAIDFVIASSGASFDD
jgi:hypothetical protein